MAGRQGSGRRRAGWPLWVAALVAVGGGVAAAWVGLRSDGEPAPGTPDERAVVREGDTAVVLEPPPYNVFIFLIDTLRADRMNTYGYTKYETSPVADWLGEHGVVFEEAVAPAPWTMPTVASLFTSTFPCQHNMLSKYDRLPDETETLAERLRRTGYATFTLFGNGFIEPEFNLDQGFGFRKKNMVTQGRHVAAALGDEPPAPFFFYVHNVEPHDPWFYVPEDMPGFPRVGREVRADMERHLKAYKAAGEYDYRRELPLGTNNRTAEQDRRAEALARLRPELDMLYDAAVRLADDHVGSVIATLQAQRLWDDTLFILVADHGEELGERGGWLHDQSAYEELMHVPLIIRFPGDAYAGVRVREPVSLVDVLPTIFEFLDREALAAGAVGHSLMPLVRGEALPEERALFVPGLRINTTRYHDAWEARRGAVNLVVRQGAWKGIWNAELDAFELYDLRADPGERRNVAAAHESLVDVMRGRAEAWYAWCHETASHPEEVGELDESTLETLRSLGYVD